MEYSRPYFVFQNSHVQAKGFLLLIYTQFGHLPSKRLASPTLMITFSF